MFEAEMEMNVFEAILARRSVRDYAVREVDRTQLRTLFEAAVRAPTAMHGEPWVFAVVQDRRMLRYLSDHARPLIQKELQHAATGQASRMPGVFSQPDFNIFYDAGTLIIIGARSSGTFVAADCWMAAENLMLAACAMGLGTCVIGCALPMLNQPEIKATLGLPEDFSAIAPIVVGYPGIESKPTARNKPVVLTGGFYAP